jgi:hypothetical protein
MNTVLVRGVGGADYVGSHSSKVLAAAGYTPVLVFWRFGFVQKQFIQARATSRRCDRQPQPKEWKFMSKITHALAAAVAAAILLGTPAVVQIGNAAEIPKAGSPLPKLPKANNAQLDAAIRQTNMAFEKIKGDKAFMEAVKSKNSAMVKAFFIKAGAPDSIAGIKFTGPAPVAQKIKIVVSGSCCPMTITIVISF